MTDTFKKIYRELTKDEKELIESIKSQAEGLEVLITCITAENSKREVALAKTKLEECVMWAVKGITK